MYVCQVKQHVHFRMHVAHSRFSVPRNSLLPYNKVKLAVLFVNNVHMYFIHSAYDAIPVNTQYRDFIGPLKSVLT